jgi:hypothetical protein
MSIVAHLLTDVDFLGSDVTDASIPILRRMQRLKSLDVRQTRLSAAGVDEIQSALKACKIER